MLNRLDVFARIGSSALLLAVAACSTPSSSRDDKPVTIAAPYGDTRLPAVARVLGQSVHTRDAEELRYAVLMRLTDRFAAEQGIVVTPAEREAWIRQVDTTLRRDGVAAPRADSPEDRAARARSADAFIRQWKINRALYQRYGGRVVFQQGGPEPLDALRRFLEDHQQRGELAFLDARLEAAFWRYFRDDSIHSFYPQGSAEEKLAFDQPPWVPR